MKKNWENPEVKNLELSETYQGNYCEAQEATQLDGNHWLVKCHHGLYEDNDIAMLCCPHRGDLILDGCKPVIPCNYNGNNPY